MTDPEWCAVMAVGARLRVASTAQLLADLRADRCVRYNPCMLDFHQRVLESLARVEQAQADHGRLLARILQKENAMALDTTALVAKVSALETVQGSAIALLQSLNAAIKAIPTDDPAAAQAAIDQITSRLDADTTSLAAAVVANTPAAPGGSTPPPATPPATPPAA